MAAYLQPGFDPTLPEQRLISAAAVVKGDVRVLDESVVDSTSLRFTTMVAVATADLEAGIFGVALEDGAANEEVLWGFEGSFRVQVNGPIALEDTLGGVNGQDYLDGTGANGKVIAKPLETNSSGQALKVCLVSGIHGFGNDNA